MPAGACDAWLSNPGLPKDCPDVLGTFKLSLTSLTFPAASGPWLRNMRDYVSKDNCLAHYGVDVNCDVKMSPDNSTATRLGEISLGGFPGDPDIAGAGVSPSCCMYLSGWG